MEHLKGHDDLNRVFDNGTIFAATSQELERYLCALGSLNIENDKVRAKAIVRALTINYLQMSRTIKEVEATMHRLNTANERTQRLVIRLTRVAITLGVIQAVTGVISIFSR
jgi:hypothetical protein